MLAAGLADPRATGAGGAGPPDGTGDRGDEFHVEARALWRTVARRFLRHRLAVGSLAVLVVITVWAFITPLFWGYGFADIETRSRSLTPSGNHPFGTDDLGKDVFAQVMRGTQRSLEIAFLVALMSTIIGVTIGAVAGFYRGVIDTILMRITDLILVIPLLIVVGVLSVSVASAPWWAIPLLLGLFSWPLMARITRAEFLAMREKEFVEAARAMGTPRARVIFRHILPNVAGPIIVNATLTIAGAILVETALSFLGLGIREPEVSLGLLINKYQNAYSTRPWLFWFPSVTIVAISLSVNFIGDGLRDAFDPKQGRVRH